eukprot:852717_1
MMSIHANKSFQLELNMAQIEIQLLRQKILILTNCCSEYTTKYKEMASLNEYLQLQHKHQANVIHKLMSTNKQQTTLISRYKALEESNNELLETYNETHADNIKLQ